MSDGKQEGELKKLFWKLKEESNDDTMVSGRITLALCDLQQILDEAKAEFPCLKEVERFSKEQFFTLDWSKWEDLYIWFKKWFGASK
jgi:hypothetical protein